MPRKKPQEATAETTAEPVAPENGPAQQAQEATNNPEPNGDEALRPRTVLAVPLDEAAKRKHTEGEVARYYDDFNSGGVSARIDSPDDAFRPSQHVNEPLKEDHEGRNKMRWTGSRWHKRVGNNPVAERLDAEGRTEEMIRRRKEEKLQDGQTR